MTDKLVDCIAMSRIKYCRRGSFFLNMSAVFYYDIVCPFAYCASHLVEAMARRSGARILWRPVLLGALV